MIPYENLKRLNEPFEPELRAAFETVLESGHFILGGRLEKFEQEFAAYHSMFHCAGVSNGLDALTLALRALELPTGSEVIVPSNTYIATVLAVLAAGLEPVLAEPCLDTYNIDPAKLELAITPRTRAVIVVHLYGKVCDMDAILDLTKKYRLKLVEDCAQAHGAMYKGRLAGTFGDMAAFSFYPTKNLGALGDAGAVLSNYPVYDSRIRRLRNYGSDRKYYNDVAGVNNRLDEMQAAFLSVKLPKLDEMNRHRNKLAALYAGKLDRTKFVLPDRRPDQYDVFHIFNIRHNKRDELQQYLSEQGVGTVIHYPVPPHRQKAMNGLFFGREFPIAEEIHETTLSIPCSFCHTEEEVLQVIDILNKF